MIDCAGNCGRKIMPVTAEDCGAQSGPWYCAECFIKKLCRCCELQPADGPDGRCSDCGEAIAWEQLEYADDATESPG